MPPRPPAGVDGSIMIVVATDVPLSDRQLRRVAARAMLGVGRTGTAVDNGSGDYVVAFSTALSARRTPATRECVSQFAELPNTLVSPVFDATAEATEEAIYNSLFQAVTVAGHAYTAPALPVDDVVRLLGEHSALRPH
eukprot:TRINITY_DN12148_c0_g1_i1.p3 TRINITY_DN12148_c0_g1~~TRINITY_DN12148_c0_g1_i1.p3  ORF type:complete len:138 (+),score=43.16 TRINITY_DN12148_c0_g1_i1:754-1167(+)